MIIDESLKSNLLENRFDLQKVLIIDYKTRKDRPQHVYFDIPKTWYTRSVIYVLWEYDTIVYIGQSIQWWWRILDHIRSPKSKNKNTTHFNILPIEKSQLSCLEKKLISYFKPIYNIQHKH